MAPTTTHHAHRRGASHIRRSGLWRTLALLLALSLVAAACGNDDDDPGEGPDPTEPDTTETTDDEPDEPDEATPDRGGRLIVGTEDEVNNWLPGSGSFANAGTWAAMAVYDPLASRGDDGQVYPYLAESIEPNDDVTEWTVTLREGIQFHDGTDLNAEVMRRIFEEYLTVEGANTAGTLSDVVEFRVDDDLTFTYVLNGPVAAFPDLLTGAVGWPFSVEACEAAGGRDGDCGNQMVGTGPFVFESWVRDGDLTLTRNDNYWRVDADGEALPYLDGMVFRSIPDEDARLNSVASDTIQVAHTLRQSSVRTARGLDGVNSFEAIGNNGGGSIFNTAVPPTDDVRIRRALAYGVDQEDLIDVLGGRDITPVQTQFFSPDSPWYSSAVADAWPTFDFDLATEYLEDYINDPDRSDGRSPGEPVEIEFACPPDPTLLDIAQAYQDFWGDLGFEISLVSVDQPTHIGRALSGEYMINCWRAGAESDPYVTLNGAFTDPETNPSNFTNYTSDSIEANLEILRTSTDFDERYAAVEDIMFELADQLPQIWTGGTATAIFARDDVRGLDAWTIPGPDRTPDILGNGVLGATTRWSDIWIEQ